MKSTVKLSNYPILEERSKEVNDAQAKVRASLDELTTAFEKNPNYLSCKEDWEAHFLASCNILTTYTMTEHVLPHNEETKIFLKNIRAHVQLLKSIRALIKD